MKWLVRGIVALAIALVLVGSLAFGLKAHKLKPSLHCHSRYPSTLCKPKPQTWDAIPGRTP